MAKTAMNRYGLKCPWCGGCLVIDPDAYQIGHFQPACIDYLLAGDALETLTAVRKAYGLPVIGEA